MDDELVTEEIGKKHVICPMLKSILLLVQLLSDYLPYLISIL